MILITLPISNSYFLAYNLFSNLFTNTIKKIEYEIKNIKILFIQVKCFTMYLFLIFFFNYMHL